MTNKAKDRSGMLIVRVKPNRYQPTKAELEERVRIETTAEEVTRRAFRQVRVVEDRNV